MIPGFFCVLLPFMPGCDAFVREVPAIAQLERQRAYFNGKTVSITGKVRRLDQWQSSNGYQQEVFSVCNGGCVRVYMGAHSSIHNGDLVTVSGSYYQAYHAGHAVYYNEIEATEVLARD